MSLLSLAVIATFGAVPVVHASGVSVIIKDSASCGTIGGTWNSGTSTCTLSSSFTLTSSSCSGCVQYLEIASGTTLAISASGTITVNSGAAIFVDSGGTITIKNSAVEYGIYNYQGTISNSGTITVDNSGTNTGGITNEEGTFTNSGTITIENSAPGTLGIYNEGSTSTFTNSGTITIENSGGDGIENSMGTFTNSNSGTITIENSGGDGIENFGGTFTNDGAITVEPTSGVAATGIENDVGGTLTNDGTIQLENSGLEGYGMMNRAYGGTSIITNDCSGTIDIANTGGTGIANYGTINEYGPISGTVTEEPPTGQIYDYSASCAVTTTSTSSTTSTSTTPTGPSSVPEFGVPALFIAVVAFAALAILVKTRKPQTLVNTP